VIDQLPDTPYVYTLAYPEAFHLPNGEDVSNVVFYCGSGVKARINAHEQEASTQCRCYKCLVIRFVWEQGRAIQKQIIFSAPEKRAVVQVERESIRTRFSGPYLVNTHHNPERSFNISCLYPRDGKRTFEVSTKCFEILQRCAEEKRVSPEEYLQKLILYGIFPKWFEW
jgi:hypothetical protein